MKESQAFTFIGNLSSFANLLSMVEEFTHDDWLNYRGRRVGIAAENSDTIPLIHDAKNRLGSFVCHERTDLFMPFIHDVVALLDEDCIIQQAMFTRLHAGVSIGRHKDKGEVTAKTHRIHVPVITNNECIFTVDDISKHLQAGEIWIIDNVDKFHSVANMGTIDRVHLIIDAMPLYNN
jgi:hypothetical protein